MLKQLETTGAHIDAIYYCPHDKGMCSCRKPETGLFLQAKADFPEIDFQNSFVIGDSQKDIEAGKRLGCKTILIVSGSQSSTRFRSLTPDFTANSLWEAVNKYVTTK